MLLATVHTSISLIIRFNRRPNLLVQGPLLSAYFVNFLLWCEVNDCAANGSALGSAFSRLQGRKAPRGRGQFTVDEEQGSTFIGDRLF